MDRCRRSIRTTVVGVEPIAERREVRREVMDFDGPDGPAGAFDHTARGQLANLWGGTSALAMAAACAIHVEAHLVLRARDEDIAPRRAAEGSDRRRFIAIFTSEA